MGERRIPPSGTDDDGREQRRSQNRQSAAQGASPPKLSSHPALSEMPNSVLLLYQTLYVYGPLSSTELVDATALSRRSLRYARNRLDEETDLLIEETDPRDRRRKQFDVKPIRSEEPTDGT